MMRCIAWFLRQQKRMKAAFAHIVKYRFDATAEITFVSYGTASILSWFRIGRRI